MKRMGTWFSIELQWIAMQKGHQGSSPRNGHQGDMHGCAVIIMLSSVQLCYEA